VCVFVAALAGCQQPLAAVRAWPVEDSAAAGMRERLKKVIPVVELEEVTFQQALDFISDRTQTNICVKWDRLAKAGFHSDYKHSWGMHDMTAEKLFSAVLCGIPALGYYFDGNVLVITTMEDAMGQRMVRIYDLAGFAASGELPPAARVELLSTLNRLADAPPSDTAAKEAGGLLCHLGSGNECAGALRDMAAAVENGFRNRRIVECADMLDSYVNAPAKKEARADIHVYGDKLVVTADSETHRRIEGVLTGLGLGGREGIPVVHAPMSVGPKLLPLPGDTAADRAAIARLGKVIPKIDFDGIAIEEAVRSLRDANALKMWVSWPGFQTLGGSKETPVALHLKGATLEQALRFTFDQPGMGDEACLVVDGGAIVVRTREQMAEKTSPRLWDVSDITRQGGFTAGERRELRGLVERVLSAPPAGSPGPQPCSAPAQRTLRELCAGHPDDLVNAIEEAQARRRVTELVGILNALGASGEWNGAHTRIMAVGDKLLIETDYLSHQAIAHFLAGLRKMSGPK
jgi:hypothetical protein